MPAFFRRTHLSDMQKKYLHNFYSLRCDPSVQKTPFQMTLTQYKIQFTLKNFFSWFFSPIFWKVVACKNLIQKNIKKYSEPDIFEKISNLFFSKFLEVQTQNPKESKQACIQRALDQIIETFSKKPKDLFIRKWIKAVIEAEDIKKIRKEANKIQVSSLTSAYEAAFVDNSTRDPRNRAFTISPLNEKQFPALCEVLPRVTEGMNVDLIRTGDLEVVDPRNHLVSSSKAIRKRNLALTESAIVPEILSKIFETLQLNPERKKQNASIKMGIGYLLIDQNCKSRFLSPLISHVMEHSLSPDGVIVDNILTMSGKNQKFIFTVQSNHSIRVGMEKELIYVDSDRKASGVTMKLFSHCVVKPHWGIRWEIANNNIEKIVIQGLWHKITVPIHYQMPRPLLSPSFGPLKFLNWIF
ncbi:MAG: hypothetical protein WCP39_07150 [Chlamydiota bacterium]